jgi:hypothetical protein
MIILGVVDNDLAPYVSKLGWTLDSASGVVSVPPNQDNQIESTVVRETIQLPRMSSLFIMSSRVPLILLLRTFQNYHTRRPRTVACRRKLLITSVIDLPWGISQSLLSLCQKITARLTRQFVFEWVSMGYPTFCQG